jgi:molecular chaperone HscB
LLNLKGIDNQGGSATIQDLALLEEQMELRERLDEVRNAAEPSRAFNEFQSQVQARYRDQQQAFTAAFAEEDLPRAAKAVTAMQFQAKLLRELQDLAEILDDEAHG